VSSASIIVSDITAPTPLTIGAERSISARDRTRRVSTSGRPRCKNHSCTCRMSDTGNIVRDCGLGDRSARRYGANRTAVVD
jgi:hypothetical protein